MLKKYLSIFVMGLLLNLAIAPAAFASDGAESSAEFAKKVKSEIARLGTGPKAKVNVTLKDGKKIKGYISQLGEDDFTVKKSEKEVGSNILYTEVKQAKGKRGLGGVSQFLIVVGVVIAVTVIVVAIGYKNARDDRVF